MILARRKNTLKWAAAQAERRRMHETLGIDQWLISSTSTNNLAELARNHAVQLALVPDIPTETPAQRMLADGCTPDEIASVYTFATGRFHEAPSIGGDAA